MAMIYRIDDLALWGLGKGSDLTPVEVDRNFWQLWSLYSAIIDHIATAVVSLHYISQPSADQISFHLTNGAVDGPFTIPTSQWNPVGPWTALTVYSPFDVFSYNASLYIVKWPHVSDVTFDPAANDGFGHDFYGLLFTVPGSVIPLGGGTGQVLEKFSDADLSLVWRDPTLRRLFDVALTTSLDDFSSLVWDAGSDSWVNERFIAEQQLLQTTVQTVTSSGGVVAIDRSLGEICELSVTENVTSVTVTGWAPNGYRGKIELKATNTGTFTVVGTPVTAWGANTPWVMSSGAGKLDRVIFSSDNGGATVLGDIVNRNYN